MDTNGVFEYTFSYTHKMTGEVLHITERGDDWKEAEAKAYKRVFSVVSDDGLDLVQTDEEQEAMMFNEEPPRQWEL